MLPGVAISGHLCEASVAQLQITTDLAISINPEKFDYSQFVQFRKQKELPLSRGLKSLFCTAVLLSACTGPSVTSSPDHLTVSAEPPKKIEEVRELIGSTLPICEVEPGDIPRQRCFFAKRFQMAWYVGEWRNGTQDGKGYMLHDDGEWYLGEFKGAWMHGHGTYSYKNGDLYEGDFKDGFRYGQGTYTHANGEVYVGGFRFNYRHGNGILTHVDGAAEKGVWEMGKLKSSATREN